ncbi:hypothetical protein [Bosea minatitlanensis]|jgi:hypothetical protein|uniref:Uncharacterized protein n=1 Tax=Bosea minatitlanensis TaxID=128782 RepID=A0ABW0F3D1_9HYPH|nr:hypothetical protein [Bosea minatitlanensis]MCT4493952.1 hypothetical protein [Bosea minatitlanensis]
MECPAPVASELRARLQNLRSAALAARLTDIVGSIDARLSLAAVEACRDLENALAKAHATLPLPELPIAAMGKPLPGARPVMPGSRRPVRLHRQPSQPVRKPTGPDRWDEEIPY